ncbi:hypothetical protein ABZ824_37545, partial [Nocardia sp. NPDC047038]
LPPTPTHPEHNTSARPHQKPTTLPPTPTHPEHQRQTTPEADHPPADTHTRTRHQRQTTPEADHLPPRPTQRADDTSAGPDREPSAASPRHT